MVPDGFTLAQVAAVLVPVCIVTLLLRALPFVFIKKLQASSFVSLLGMTMPMGVMTVLLVYTLAGQKEAPGGMWAALLGVAITLGLHWWRRDPGLSIIGGTVAYMALVNLVF